MATIKEIDKYCSLCMDINCTGCEYHDVHFRNVKKNNYGNEEESVYPIPEMVTNELFEFAKHFFELGIKVQKGE